MTVNIFGLTGHVENKMTKCLTGYIPVDPENNGFVILASSNNDRILNVFRDNKGNWTSGEETVSWIRIRCPLCIRIWAVGIHGTNSNSNTVYNVVLKGTNDNSRFKIISEHSSTMMNEFVLLKINQNVPAYNMISVEFKSDMRTSITLKKLQLFVHNE